MHDIRVIRDDPDQFDRLIALRNIAPKAAGILEMDRQNRALITEKENLLSERNRLSAEVSQAKRSGANADDIIAHVQKMKADIAQLDEAQKALKEELHDVLAAIPNLPDSSVPYGNSEEDNVLVRDWGDVPEFDFVPKEHFELGEDLQMMNFPWATQLAGARFNTLFGDLARLERALGNFMIDMHTAQHGLTEVALPVLVNSQTMYNTGQLPKFGEDLYQVTDDYWLIPTSEVPLTNYAAKRIFNADELPVRLTALTQCFRREAGAAGRDTRGMLRQHQFSKVEMVTLSHPDRSMDELERMTDCAENILKALKIPYRVMLLCSNDMGPGAVKTYDIETWLPGQNSYREISSCSNCGPYQAQRMSGRMKTDAGNVPIHTLNGSGLAVGRALIAVMENYQQENGTIVIPEALRPYMAGQESIG